MLSPGFNKVIFNNNTYSGEWVAAQVAEIADYLKTLKTSSPFVLLFAHNHINTILAYFGILQSGHSCVLLEPHIGPIELSEIRDDTKSSVEIRYSAGASEFVCKRDIIFKPGKKKWYPEFPEINQPSTIVYTNAESGYAKGAVLTSDNLYSNAHSHSYANQSSPNSVVCSLPPFHHLFGLTTGVICPSVAHCSTLVVDVSDLKRINYIADQIADAGVTHLYSVPILLHWLLRTNSIKKIIDNVQFLSSGGYKLPIQIFNQYKSRFNVEIHEGYGLTEASPICTWHHPDDKINPESVGNPTSCCKIKIIDKNGNNVPCGTTGEVCIAGPHVMAGYLNNRNATKEILNNGWLKTGDLGYLNNEVELFLAGLKKNMANVAGKSIYPAEIYRLIKNNTPLTQFDIVIEPTSIQGDKLTLNIYNKDNIDFPNIKNEIRKIISTSKIPKIRFC
jgi:long-chain acyl-CoA synthetase